MGTIFIDERPYEVDERQNLLAACLSLGFDLPYFCWHPAMGSVGACRQCAVKQFKNQDDRQGRLVMACMTPASEGSRIAIADPEAKAFRASVIEWLMANHPHDCPVCDEGGECHLQDMTFMAGHVYRRYRFPKRTYRNQYLGPFVRHDMNRCIQCYRCVRFYRDYARGRDLNVFSSHDTVYFGRAEDGVLENEFSGNLVEVCPTGVFTDNTLFRHYARKWDLQSAQSICPHCSAGCNTTPGERSGVLRRIVNRFNSQVNGYFLCDRGRYGYEYVNGQDRIRAPFLCARPEATPDKPAEPAETISYAVHLLDQARGVIGIGSPRASIEANIALRSLVGAERFYLGIGDGERRLLDSILKILRDGPVASASLAEAEASDGVLVLGEDLLNTAPRLALALLQSVRQEPLEQAEALQIPRWDDAALRNVIQDRRGPLFLSTHRRTWFDDVATESVFATPDDSARLGFAVAHHIESGAPSVDDLSPHARALASRIAEALLRVKRPLVVAGTGARSAATIEAAANVAWALKQRHKEVRLSFVAPECNSLGLVMIGGRALSDAFQAVEQGRADTAVVLENDLFERAPETQVAAFTAALRGLVVLDSMATSLTGLAHAVFPASTTAESDGTFINAEGRAQRFYQVLVPDGEAGESWRWIREIARACKAPHATLGGQIGELASWRNFDDAVSAAGRAVPAFACLPDVAPSAQFRVVGQKIPRQPERFSGRTAVSAHRTVHEPQPPPDPDTPLAFSMEGARPGHLPSPLIPQFWEPGWHSNQALNKYQQEVGGPLCDEWPGIRLIEADRAAQPRWFSGIPDPHRMHPDRWLLLPLAHLFGTEELSRRAPAIAERTPPPYIMLAPADAERLGLEPDAPVDLMLHGSSRHLIVKMDPRMTAGIAGIFLHRHSQSDLPAWTDLRQSLGRTRRAA